MKTAAATNSVLANRDSNATNKVDVPRSPSVISICSDGGIECCTPPHKKVSMYFDDCGDYSPKVFDSSFSPSCLLSQTLAIDSPEVGWKWNRYSTDSKDEISTRTPDSAYAADSSFTSAGSSSTEINARARNDTYNQRMAYDARREQQLRKVEKTRADLKLKQRCAKLQEQLKSAGTQKSNSSSPKNSLVEKNGNAISSSSSSCTLKSTDTEMTSQTMVTTTTKSFSSMEIDLGTVGNASETINDFFNDSDEDCFLLAATQEIESKMSAQQQQKSPATTMITTNNITTVHNTVNVAKNNSDKLKKNTNTSPPKSPPTTSAGCLSATKEKRSSFYMKFLEDDCPDDWFVSLDEVIEQATQSKKPRTSFQRYKSMPMNSNDTEGDRSASKTSASSDPTLNGNESEDLFVESKGMPSSSKASLALRSKIKRHSSSNALSPSNANCKYTQCVEICRLVNGTWSIIFEIAINLSICYLFDAI